LVSEINELRPVNIETDNDLTISQEVEEGGDELVFTTNFGDATRILATSAELNKKVVIDGLNSMWEGGNGK
jgi:hypothetical protein